MNVLLLPVEILAHIGKYLGDIDRSAAARTCRYFRDGFSYVEPWRRLPCGRILVDTQVDLLRAFDSVVSDIRHREKDSDDVIWLECIMRRSYEPYLMSLVMCGRLSPIAIFSSGIDLDCLKYTYRHIYSKDCICVNGISDYEARVTFAELTSRNAEDAIIFVDISGFYDKKISQGDKIRTSNVFTVFSDSYTRHLSVRDTIREVCIIETDTGLSPIRLEIKISTGESGYYPPRSDKVILLFSTPFRSLAAYYYRRWTDPIFRAEKTRNKSNRRKLITEKYVMDDKKFEDECKSVYKKDATQAFSLFTCYPTFEKYWHFDEDKFIQIACSSLYDHIMSIFSQHGSLPIIYMRKMYKNSPCGRYTNLCPLHHLILQFKTRNCSSNIVCAYLRRSPCCVYENEQYLRSSSRCRSFGSNCFPHSDIGNVLMAIDNFWRSSEPSFAIFALSPHTYSYLPPMRSRGCIIISETSESPYALINKFNFLNERGERIRNGTEKFFFFGLNGLYVSKKSRAREGKGLKKRIISEIDLFTIHYDIEKMYTSQERGV